MKRNKKHISSICLAAALLSLSVPGTVRAEESAGWVSDEAGWRYIEADGTGAAPGWKLIDGSWYWFEDSGRMRTGWLLQGDTWYYLDDSGTMASGWRTIGGKSYYFTESGAMKTGHVEQNGTVYSFHSDGSVDTAKKEKNTGGGAFEIGFYDEACQNLASNLNELKLDSFDGDEDEDYYEDDKKDYDRDASYEISGKLTEIAAHRLAMAREKGYGNGKIPEEGDLTDYLNSIQYNGGRRHMEVYIKNVDGAGEAEEKLLDIQEDAKKREDRPDYYGGMGIAHTEVNGSDYYMVIFMK